MKSVYVVTCFYNPAWGLRSSDNYYHFDKVMLTEDKPVADELGEEYRKEKQGMHVSVSIKRQPILEWCHEYLLP
ncbi:hypothetical protein MQM1_077 [Aeromonas phage vB_AsaP_MQM1]|nr:hypothetical protein MQM1_077 [Aeromonas phage vB_AsaP_MQM1]